jgi:PIN domain nuclease of toxin-antitoxin system
MKLLLDTHIFIWWADAPEKLSSVALSALEDEANDLILSVVSIWEIQIKSQLGKLKFSQPLRELIKSQQEANGLKILPIELPHSGIRCLAISSQRPVRPIVDCPKHCRRYDTCYGGR